MWWPWLLLCLSAGFGNSQQSEIQREDSLKGERGPFDHPYQPSDWKHESPPQSQRYDGVAATLFLGSPKWFQQRYPLMINQMKASLPSSWVIQVFYLPHNAMAEEAIHYRGIQKNILSGHVVVTPIPPSFGRRVRKKDFLRMPWFWRTLLADRVLLFGGNAVLCGSSPYGLQDFLAYDYVGAQWNILRGIGGSGALSLRNRTSVLEFIEARGGDSYHLLDKDPEDIALVKGLSNVAPREVTLPHLTTSVLTGSGRFRFALL